MGRFAWALLTAAAFALPAQPAGAQAFDPASLGRAVGEARTEILVFGSPHLAQAEEAFDPAWLDPILAALEQYRPAAIVIESLPGEALHGLVAYEGLYPGVADMFASTRLRLSGEAATRLGTTMQAAEVEARRLLASWPAAPSARDRRRLAALLIAAGDLNSALVQWLRLPESERAARDGIGEEAAAHLRRMAGSRNENVSIAVRLAVRLGLERLDAMDDQSETDLVFSALDAVTEAERSPAWSAARARRPMPTYPPMTSAPGVLAAFRAHNSEDAGRRDAENQWLTRLETADASGILRRRVAGWETRNLRMAANIREVSARHPGRRILVLVGSAHKPYLDAYLRMMSDVRVVPAGEILGGAEPVPASAR